MFGFSPSPCVEGLSLRVALVRVHFRRTIGLGAHATADFVLTTDFLAPFLDRALTGRRQQDLIRLRLLIGLSSGRPRDAVGVAFTRDNNSELCVIILSVKDRSPIGLRISVVRSELVER